MSTRDTYERPDSESEYRRDRPPHTGPSGYEPSEGGVEFQVVCVTREPSELGHSHIARLGIKSDNRLRILTEEEVVNRIRAGERFYVLKNGNKAYLKISISERGRPFVETVADRTTLDNLAALPTCEERNKIRRLFAWWLPLWLLLLTILLCVIIWILFHPACPCPPPPLPPSPSIQTIIVTRLVTQTVPVTSTVIVTQTVLVTATPACLTQTPTGTPPPIVLAEFLKNGNFEGGFGSNGVANNWFAFDSGGENVNFSYHDDDWSAVVIGCHSQLIEIDTRRFSVTVPDRFSGIGQTVSGLKPGSEYRLTLHGVIRTSEGDRDTDNLSYVVEWGTDMMGGSDWKSVSEWHRVPWDHVYFRSSPGPLREYSTQFVASSSKVTLLIRLLKKQAKPFNELLLNLDDLSLSGPQ